MVSDGRGEKSGDYLAADSNGIRKNYLLHFYYIYILILYVFCFPY